MHRNRRFWFLSLVALSALVFVAAKRSDVHRVRFQLALDGVSLGNFESLDGPGLEIEVIEFRDGTDPVPRKLPGRTKWSNIVLKRGVVDPSFFESWIHEVRTGTPGFRKNLTLSIVDRNDAPVKTYDLSNCWPASWKLGTLDAKGPDIVIEEVVIAIERFERR